AIQSGYVSLLDGSREAARFSFTGADFAEERALMLLEIYRKDGIWRLCALGQGFNGGLAALVRHFGGEVAPEAAPPAPPKPPAPPVNLSKITLEKRGNTVSLDKKPGSAHGEILINLNWNTQRSKKGFLGFAKSANIDLDLGCLYEFQNGMKGAVQALGNAFGSYHDFPYISLDADDRTGARSEGENLRINGQYWDEFKRILVYAFIYEGVPNWSEADGVITIRVPDQPEIEVRLDSHRNDRPMCGIAMLENRGGSMHITKLVDYYRGHLDLDEANHWGLRWTRGSKD
ncbi:TerD family protein, partial [Methylocaldum szegediense]|uniref:TerD family protein n=1 Tax=Methylocaldum szegediense TaxID=73780 RepID=UPI00055A737C